VRQVIRKFSGTEKYLIPATNRTPIPLSYNKCALQVARLITTGHSAVILLCSSELTSMILTGLLREDNITMCLHKVGLGTWTGFIWLRLGTGGRLL
jgi:hypothetical protein